MAKKYIVLDSKRKDPYAGADSEAIMVETGAYDKSAPVKTTPTAQTNSNQVVTPSTVNTARVSREESNPMQAYMDALEAQRLAAQRARQAQIDNAVARVAAQRGVVDQNYEEAARQAYIQKRLAERDLGQQLSASGLSGGASESSRLNLQNQYGENLNNLRRDRDNAMADIEGDIAEIEANGIASLADIDLDYQKQLAQQALALMNQNRSTGSSSSSGSSSTTTRTNRTSRTQEESTPAPTQVITPNTQRSTSQLDYNTALAMMRSNASTPTQMMDYINSLYRQGRLTDAVANMLARVATGNDLGANPVR